MDRFFLHAGGRESRTCANEALGVQAHAAAIEPARCRICADEDENVADVLLRLRSGDAVAPPDALKLPLRRTRRGIAFGGILCCEIFEGGF